MSEKINAGAVSGAVLVVATIISVALHYRFVIKMLTAEEAGVWLLFWSLGSYIAFFDLGIGPTISREIAFLNGKSYQNKSASNFVKIATLFYLFIGGTLLAISLSFGTSLLRKFEFVELSIDSVYLSWNFFILGSVVNLIGNVSLNILTGCGFVVQERLVRAAGMFTWLFISSIALYAGLGIEWLGASWLVNSIIVRIFAHKLQTRLIPNIRFTRGKWNKLLAKRLTEPSAKWALTQFGALIILQTDNIIIAWKLGVESIPPYEAAARVIVALGTVSLLKTNASIPYYSRYFATQNHKELRHLLRANMNFTFKVLAIAISLVLFFGVDLFHIWLGEKQYVGNAILIVMMITMAFEVHHVSHASMTMSSGYIPFVPIAFMAGFLNIVFSLFLVERFGLLGVILGTMIAQVTTNNWYAVYVNLKLLKIDLREYITNVLIHFGYFVIVSITVQFLIDIFSANIQSEIRLVLCVIGALSTYIFLNRLVPGD